MGRFFEPPNIITAQVNNKNGQYKTINVPPASDEDLNLFLRRRQIVNVTRELVRETTPPCWMFCVEYLDGAQLSDASDKRDHKSWSGKSNSRIIFSIRLLNAFRRVPARSGAGTPAATGVSEAR